MKQEILRKLEMAQKMIGLMIGMVESNKPDRTIIAKIDHAQEELQDIKNLILKNHLDIILKQAGLRKNKRENLLKLCGFSI